jgi:glycosyltransferase involved in cell wall biosynthesis
MLWPRGVDGNLFRPDRPNRSKLREALGFGPDDVVIGHVSRLAAEKNVMHLAEALKAVGEARPNVRFLFVGDGPARPELETVMGPNARFVGYQGGEDLADHYASADLFAFASLTETFGNVVLEALASGLPVVAIRAGGVGEIVRSGETGILVEPSAPPSQMAGALLGLADNAGLRHEMAESARAYALTQTWPAIMGRLRDRYLGLADRVAPVSTSV